MEFLLQHGQSQANIGNYMAALRAYHIINNLSTASFKDERIQIFQKSLKLQAPSLLTIDLLTKIIQQCQNLPFSFIFRPVYLLAFFSFFRISNILPHSTTFFGKNRLLAHGDIIIQSQGAVVLVKWSRTIQNKKDVATVSVPALGDSLLCPTHALNVMITGIPASDNDLLFLFP